MPGQQVMLQGRFFTQLRKLGAIGITTTAVVGVFATSVYFKRAKAMHIFNTTWSKEDDRKLSDRVLKYQGHYKDPDYPNIPFVQNKGGMYDKLFVVYRMAGRFIILEYMNLVRVDPDILDTFVKVILEDLSGNNWFDTEAEKTEAYDRIMKAREAALKLPDENEYTRAAKQLYVNILKWKPDLVDRHCIVRSLFLLDH